MPENKQGTQGNPYQKRDSQGQFTDQSQKKTSDREKDNKDRQGSNSPSHSQSGGMKSPSKSVDRY